MIEILIVLLVLGAATVVFYPALSGTEDPVGIVKRPRAQAAVHIEDEDAMQVLVERKERIFRNLRELDSERAAGRLGEAEYQEFKQRDEIEAVQVLKDIGTLQAAAKQGKSGRKSGQAAGAAGARPWSRRLAWMGGVAVFAVLLGLTMSKAIAPRTAGGTITGTVPGESGPGNGGGEPSPLFPNANPERLKVVAEQVAKDSNNLKALLEAGHLYLGAQAFNEAASVTIRALQRDARSAEAHAHIAVLLMAEASSHENADSAQMAVGSALQAIDQAIRLDSTLPEAWLFKGMVLMSGRQDQSAAVDAWEHYLKIAPADADTVRIAAMVRGFRRSQQ